MSLLRCAESLCEFSGSPAEMAVHRHSNHTMYLTNTKEVNNTCELSGIQIKTVGHFYSGGLKAVLNESVGGEMSIFEVKGETGTKIHHVTFRVKMGYEDMKPWFHHLITKATYGTIYEGVYPKSVIGEDCSAKSDTCAVRLMITSIKNSGFKPDGFLPLGSVIMIGQKTVSGIPKSEEKDDALIRKMMLEEGKTGGLFEM